MSSVTVAGGVNSAVMFNSTTTNVDEDGAVSNMTTIELLRLISDVYLSLPLALAGLVGNIVSMLVLSRLGTSFSDGTSSVHQTTVILLALAVSDIAYLSSAVLLRSLPKLELPGYRTVYPHIFRWLYPTTYLVRMSGEWLTVLLTAERYIAVSRPLDVRRLCTLGRTRAAVGVIVIVVTIFTIPRYWEHEVVSFDVNEFGFAATELTHDPTYTIAYRIIGFLFVMYVFPVTTLTVLNCRLISALRRASRSEASVHRRHLHLRHCAQTSDGGRVSPGEASVNQLRSTLIVVEKSQTAGIGTQRRRDDAAVASDGDGEGRTFYRSTMSTPGQSTVDAATRTITRVAVAVVVVSIICDVFTMTSHALWSLHTCFRSLKHLEVYRRYLANVSNVLSTINSAKNFIIYCALSSRFRTILSDCLRCKTSQHTTRQSVTYNRATI